MSHGKSSPFCPTLGSRHMLRDWPVVAEDPADSLAAANGARSSLRRRAFDQLVRESLVISLAMVMRGEFVQCVPQMPLAERDDPAPRRILRRHPNHQRTRVSL